MLACQIITGKREKTEFLYSPRHNDDDIIGFSNHFSTCRRVSTRCPTSQICSSPNNCLGFVQFPLHKGYSSGDLVSHYYPSVGLNISIPSDWIQSPNIQSINEIATYNTPFQGQADKFSENLVIKKGRYLSNLSSPVYSNATLAGLEKLPNFQLQERNDEFTLSGFQANKFRYRILQIEINICQRKLV